MNTMMNKMSKNQSELSHDFPLNTYFNEFQIIRLNKEYNYTNRCYTRQIKTWKLTSSYEKSYMIYRRL